MIVTRWTAPIAHLVSDTYDKERLPSRDQRGAARCRLRAYRFDWETENGEIQFRERVFDDGSGVHDVIQMIDVAIWQATLHYGPKMNGAIAKVVAGNTLAEFQENLIEDVSN